MTEQQDQRPDPNTPDGALKLARYVSDTLPDDPFTAVKYVHTTFTEVRNCFNQGNEAKDEYHNAFMSFYALWKALLAKYGFEAEKLQWSTDRTRNIATVMNAIESSANKVLQALVDQSFSNVSSFFDEKIVQNFYYELSETEIQRIQTLVDELRELIAKAGEIEDEHRRRLLMRLEELQRELHKRVSDFDHVWGLIVEGAAYLGQAGNEVKPIVDRLKEIKEIFWGKVKERENLPPAQEFPQIEDKS